jgi:glycosyltransferase involved in cell wall biosynthesis
MKIVFITTTLTIGGAEMMLLKLLQHLDRTRFEPTVISLRSKGAVGPRIEALGIPVLALGMNPGLPNPLKLIALVNHLRQIKPDLVQTWMYHADLLGGVAARLAGCKALVWGLRNSNLDAQLTKRSTLWVVRACAALSAWLPSRILSCSTRAMSVHVAAGYLADKMHVIPNGFDLGRFQPDDEARQSVRAELGLADEAPLVGLMARYDSQKNHRGFLEAATLVHQQMPAVHFVLAGGGIDHCNAALNETIKAHGLGPYVHLLGRRDDMPRLMAALDVLASSSYGEAFPNVLGEAMACGVPCVVTDVGDSAEIVNDTGRVVQSGNMQGLARHTVMLLRLIPEEKLALSQKARERVEKHYGIEHVAKLYGAFYKQLVKTK